MRIARFNVFVDTATKDNALKSRAKNLEIFRCWEGEWFESDHEKVSEPQLLVALERTLRESEPWKRRSSLKAYFPISALDAVVVGEFWNSPMVTTRDAFQKELMDCVENAFNAYSAKYDELTSIPKELAFSERLESAISEKLSVTEQATSGTLSTSMSTAVAVLAIDIDYFKQVNDSYGHQYGNVVLRCLAIRLEEVGSTILSDKDYLKEVLVARLHGEEFAILIQGSFAANQIREISEYFRVAVTEQSYQVRTNGNSCSGKEWPIN